MQPDFSDRINDVPRSFIREILKVAVNPEIISFAGGLPNRDLFPAEGIRIAANSVLETDPGSALQYGSTEGYAPLREFIAKRYKERNIEVDSNDILITTGSQQGLDLLAKVLLNEGDQVCIEQPGYLGAIQAFAVYRAQFLPVPLYENGIDLHTLKDTLAKKPKLFYTVPNFQNPSGMSYNEENRHDVARLVKETDTLLIEDDPYHELRFNGQPKTSFGTLLPEQCVMLGSFSKIVAPSFRIGWLVAKPKLMEKLVIAKQATDLHTSEFTQRILHTYLSQNDINSHIEKIRSCYGQQCQAMLSALKDYFPTSCQYSSPEGGMFLWVTLPDHLTAMDLFDRAVANNVAFVPGDPFYVDGQRQSTLRLNFSCANEEMIREGIKRLSQSID